MNPISMNKFEIIPAITHLRTILCNASLVVIVGIADMEIMNSMNGRKKKIAPITLRNGSTKNFSGYSVNDDSPNKNVKIIMIMMSAKITLIKNARLAIFNDVKYVFFIRIAVLIIPIMPEIADTKKERAMQIIESTLMR